MSSPRYPPPPADATPEQLREYERGLWNYHLLNDTWRRTRFNEQPNALLQAAVHGRPPGTALDVHMGEGRNALYLAQLGWQVTGIDLADQALVYAQEQARQRGLRLTTLAQDSATYDWGTAGWDLIVLCYADEAAHAEQVSRALRPGGLVVFENLLRDDASPRLSRTGQPLGFAPGELPARYSAAGLHILRYEEPLGVADFSRETQRLVQLVAQKPQTAGSLMAQAR